MITGAHALVPVKNLDHAKSRLQEVLNTKQRRELAGRLLHDTLTKLVDSSLERVFVVTSNREVTSRAKALGAEVIPEPRKRVSSSSGTHGRLNQALEEGRRIAVADGATSLLTIPIDLVLLPSFDLDQALAEIAGVVNSDDEQPPSVFLESDDKTDGTNFLFQHPAKSVDFLYGVGSFREHEGNAIARGKRFRELDEPALRWDIDDPSDPKRWARAITADTEHSAEFAERLASSIKLGTALSFVLKTEWGRPLVDVLEQS